MWRGAAYMHAQNNTEHSNLKHTLSSYLIGVLFGIIAMLAAYILFAVAATAVDLPKTVLSGMAIAGLAIAGFVAGYFAAHMLGSRGLLSGLAAGAILAALFLLFSLVVFRGGFTILLLIKLIVLLLLAAVGGIFGVNKKKHH